MTNIVEILTERGNRYGKFEGQALISQSLKSIAEQYTVEGEQYPRWNSLTVDQREALEMIFHKIGRILNGDPNYADSWDDIAGYAKLIGDRLNGVKR